MENHGILFNAIIYLASAVVAVPFAKRLGLGSVLGYLAAGIIIGPWGLRLVTDVEDIFHFAEFGVVLLLFIVGLELKPSRLWEMRTPVLGLGGAQVILTTAILFGIGLLLQLDWRTALIAAMGLSLSSTAIALQILSEKNLLNTPSGKSAFSILLFQDIAVIPMLAFLPMLGVPEVSENARHASVEAIEVVIVIAGIVIGGHYLTRPLFRVIASTRLPEIFTAFSLLLVIGIALLMQAVEMSMALGAFLAGVLLSESEYRHQLESEIEPFKGLLMGLFFIAVGMSIDFGILLQQPVLIALLVISLVLIKMLVLFLLGKISRIPNSQNIKLAFVLCQGGEFAFVLFGAAQSISSVNLEIVNLLTVVVALSMMMTPLLMLIDEKFIEAKYTHIAAVPAAQEIFDEENTVIVAGFGRVGQIVARLLHANKIPTTVIDHNPGHIDRVRKFGFKVFYGDVTRLDLLRSAGAGKACIIVLAIDDREAVLETIDTIHTHFPKLKIVARAWDMVHAYQLLDRGVEIFERETLDSALSLGEKTLQLLGFRNYRAKRASQKFKIHDTATLYRLYEVHKNDKEFITLSQEARQELEKLFEADAADIQVARESGWDR